jgi:hypothetical protein
VPHQIAVTVRAPLRPGRGPEVAALLDADPREPRGGTFAEQAEPVSRCHRDLPGSVRVRGGAYFSLPGVAALRHPAHLPAEQWPDAAPDEESR